MELEIIYRLRNSTTNKNTHSATRSFPQMFLSPVTRSLRAWPRLRVYRAVLQERAEDIRRVPADTDTRLRLE